MSKINISKESIANFLEGHNPMKYVVAIECTQSSNIAHIVINDPNLGKSVIKRPFKSFMYITKKVGESLYRGDRSEIRAAMKRFNVTFKTLKTTDDNGFEPLRMQEGFKFLAETTGSYFDLVSFFKNGGCNPNQRENPNNPNQYPWNKEFVTCKPEEQFMIQTGIRLFKGFDDYNDLHRMQFDLETTGLSATNSKTFQIGIRDNKPFKFNDGTKVDNLEIILETKGEDSKSLRESERNNIKLFAQILRDRKPDIIAGYNSEEFDWPFLEERCRILSLDFNEIFKGLNGSSIRRDKARLKLGSETIDYMQAKLWGFNVLDISHSVRRTMAINSEIKSWSLKWITQYSQVAKPNRVYVPGELIHKTWADEVNDYYYNDTNGDWFKYDENIDEQLVKLSQGGYTKVKGAFIVQRYLKDDLWETEVVDGIYNQASFLMAKIIPTGYMRSSTMGTAGIWQLIMLAWSYENNLAVPKGQPSKTFVGGLSRLCEVGYRRNVVKLDYAALYPNTEITHDIFPEHDISGVMKGLLVYIAETRDEYKDLKGVYEKKAAEVKKEYDLRVLDEAPKEELDKLKKEYLEFSFLASNYDKKQLPIKILANSFFGSFGAPHVFNWGDIDCAEETTCRGRQYLRLMVTHFRNYGFVPLVADTDGMNFAIPDNIDEVTYLCEGIHRFTEKNKGKMLTGLDAVVSEFNDKYMIGRMGLDIDDICASTINFSRKNYANDIIKKGKSKVKLVGNTIKSNKMPKYIEEFLGKGIRFLLDDEGDKFVELYYETVDNIVNYNIPLSKIASKARVKSTHDTYKDKCLMKNKAGNPMPRQAHMELVLRHDLKTSIGDTIYYINTGSKKSDGDLKSIKNDDGTTTIELNCKLLPNEEVENNPEATTDEYNAKKYLDMFNKRISKLMVCFNKNVRDSIIVDYVKSKEVFTINEKGRKVYEDILQDRQYFSRDELYLCNGEPLGELDQDDVDLDLMLLEDREVEFWKRVGKQPNNMTEEFWNKFLIDYNIRKEEEQIYNVFKSKEQLIKLGLTITLDEINNKLKEVPPVMKANYDFIVEEGNLYIIAFGKKLCNYNKLNIFEPYIETIDEWLKANPKKKVKHWLDKYEETVIDYSSLFKEIFGEEYKPEDIKYVPRIYKDYDLLEAEADKV